MTSVLSYKIWQWQNVGKIPIHSLLGFVYVCVNVGRGGSDFYFSEYML